MTPLIPKTGKKWVSQKNNLMIHKRNLTGLKMICNKTTSTHQEWKILINFILKMNIKMVKLLMKILLKMVTSLLTSSKRWSQQITLCWSEGYSLILIWMIKFKWITLIKIHKGKEILGHHHVYRTNIWSNQYPQWILQIEIKKMRRKLSFQIWKPQLILQTTKIKMK
jgi:hypothetical protein